jgi:hypothetical protein
MGDCANVGGNPSPGLGLFAKESENGKDLSAGEPILEELGRLFMKASRSAKPGLPEA